MIQALRGRVVVLPNEPVTETEGGISVVGSYNPEKGLRRGKVVSVGEGVRYVNEGDEACYLAFSGVPIHHEGTKYLVMMEDDVVGVTI